jgi:hypothetical protein
MEESVAVADLDRKFHVDMKLSECKSKDGENVRRNSRK